LAIRSTTRSQSHQRLYKTELIKPRGRWRTIEQVEYATVE
jgi:hypothetical protein